MLMVVLLDGRNACKRRHFHDLLFWIDVVLYDRRKWQNIERKSSRICTKNHVEESNLIVLMRICEIQPKDLP